MPYNLDPKRLDQMLPYLAPLAAGKAVVEWSVLTGSPNTVAFRIREALHIARQHPVDYPDLAKVSFDYTIGVDPVTRKVTAKRRGMLTALSMPDTTQAAPSAPAPAPIEMPDISTRWLPKPAPSPFSLPQANSVGTFSTDGPQSTDRIITLWQEGGSVKRTLYFPEARLSETQLIELWLWADEARVMIMHAEPAVTLSAYNPQVVEYSWRPASEALEKFLAARA